MMEAVTTTASAEGGAGWRVVASCPVATTDAAVVLAAWICPAIIATAALYLAHSLNTLEREAGVSFSTANTT